MSIDLCREGLWLLNMGPQKKGYGNTVLGSPRGLPGTLGTTLSPLQLEK